MKLPSDPFVLELLPEFIEDWLEKLSNEFNPAMKEKDSETLYRIAHTIKGSSFQFGFDELGNLGITMMEQVNNSDWESLEQNKEFFRNRLIEIQEYLKNNN
jgi:HPt (histidine-containing phosphotransfer) domain-containing protein